MSLADKVLCRALGRDPGAFLGIDNLRKRKYNYSMGTDAVTKTQGADMKELPTELTTGDLARLAGVTPAFIRLVISEGKLRAVKRGRDWLVSRYDAVRWLEERRDAAQ